MNSDRADLDFTADTVLLPHTQNQMQDTHLTGGHNQVLNSQEKDKDKSQLVLNSTGESKGYRE